MCSIVFTVTNKALYSSSSFQSYLMLLLLVGGWCNVWCKNVADYYSDVRNELVHQVGL